LPSTLEADSLKPSAAQFEVVVSGAVASIRLSPKAKLAYDDLQAGRDEKSIKTRRQLARYLEVGGLSLCRYLTSPNDLSSVGAAASSGFTASGLDGLDRLHRLVLLLASRHDPERARPARGVAAWAASVHGAASHASSSSSRVRITGIASG
jgi:hypothetical protein